MPDFVRVGKAKVRRGASIGYWVETCVIWQLGDKFYISRYNPCAVRRVDPPEGYPGRRSPGLIEWEEVR